jgi:spore germination protein KB
MALFSFVAPTAKGKPNKPNKPNEPKKIFIKGLLTATLILLIANLRNLFILGVPSLKQFYFSSYQTVSVISIGEFFTRFEILIGVNLLLACFIKLCVLLFTSSIGLAKLFNIKGYKKMAAPCGLMMAFLCMINFGNTEEHFRFMKFFRIYTVPFEVILPIIIWIAIEIKTRIKKGETSQEPENTGSLE